MEPPFNEVKWAIMGAVGSHGARLRMTVMEAAAHSRGRPKAARGCPPARVFIIYSAFLFYFLFLKKAISVLKDISAVKNKSTQHRDSSSPDLYHSQRHHMNNGR